MDTNTGNRHSDKIMNDIFGKILFTDLPIGLIMVDTDANIVEANDYIFQYFDILNKDVNGRRFGNLFNCSSAVSNSFLCGTDEICKTCEINRGLHQVLTDDVELKEVELSHSFIINNRADMKWFTINAKRILFENENYALVAFTDITNRKKIEKDLVELGITDGLTGLYNRNFIIKQFEITLNVLQNGLFPLSLAFLDVDKFKDVNDNYGHTFGDEVLSTLAKLFLKHISENDYVGRYGGEEFLIIFNNTDINVAEKTLLHISDEFKAMMTDRIGVPISFSAGLIEIDAENAKAEGINALIDKADKLMYRAKAEGRDRIMLG